MDDDRYERLLEYLHETVGDDLGVVISFDEESYEFLHGREFFEAYRAEYAEKSPDSMHQDAFLELRKSALDSGDYGGEVYSKIRVMDIGTGCFIFEGDTEGLFVWLDQGAEIRVPSFVEDCIEIVRPGTAASD